MDKRFNEGTVYVSPGGHDNGDGSQAHPIATLQRAAELTGEAKRGGIGRVTVHVAAGKYFLAKPLFLTEADSDTDWVADGEVILTGAMPLVGLHWRDYEGNPAIKVADVAKGLTIDQLFVNGEQQIMARYPNYNGAEPLQGSPTPAASPPSGALIPP